MSVKHPIIAVTGSSGAGTTTVMKSFTHIFRREGINAQIVEGDALHRYDRAGMRAAMQQHERDGVRNFSHFGPDANLLRELEDLFASYGNEGKGRYRHYVHDEAEAARFGQEAVHQQPADPRHQIGPQRRGVDVQQPGHRVDQQPERQLAVAGADHPAEGRVHLRAAPHPALLAQHQVLRVGRPG